MAPRTLEVEDRRLAMSASLDADEVLRSLRDGVAELAGAAVVSLWSPDDGPPADPRVAEVARTRRPVREPGTHVIPVAHQDTLLGVLTCAGDEAPGLASLLDHAVVALRNAKLFERHRRRERETTAAYELARRLSTRLGVEQILDHVVDGVVEALACDGAASYRWSDARGGLVYVRGRNHDEAMVEQLVLKPGQGVAGRAYAERRPVWSRDRAGDASVRYPDEVKDLFARAARFRAYLAVPILFRDEVVGVLGAHYRAAHEFTGREVEVVTNLATLAATAIENARLYEDGEARQERLEALVEVNLHLSRIQSVQTLLNTLAEGCGRLLDADSVGFRLIEGEQMLLMGSWGDSHRFPVRRTFRVGDGLSGTIAFTGAPLNVRDSMDDLRPEHRATLERIRCRAWLGVPVKLGDRVVGVLTNRTHRAEGFSEDDVRIAAAFASQAAIALENARLYADSQQRRETAEHLAAVLEARNAELASFAYAVSHDLKAPLVSLQGMAGLLAEDCGPHLGEQGAHYVERLRVTVNRMERLVGDVLTLACSGRDDHVPDTVALDDVVDGILVELADRVQARGVTVTRGELGTLHAARTEIEQVFSNLIGNAIEYLGDAPAPAVEIGRVDRGEWAECFVRDTGIGIDPGFHATVFEAFQRLKDVPVEGSGVGLAIVRKIVESAGGRVWVESARGEGATFFFTWPSVGPSRRR